jgi:hypothetical protein
MDLILFIGFGWCWFGRSGLTIGNGTFRFKQEMAGQTIGKPGALRDPWQSTRTW